MLTNMDQELKWLLIGSVGIVLYGIAIITCPRFDDLIANFLFDPLFHIVDVVLSYVVCSRFR
jgi:hypothetical protein